MSKVSFRARALDVNKPMPIYRYEDIPDLRDFDKINRAVVQMPTGMEKEEETETHLQKALTAQQFYGSAEARAIPIPGVWKVGERYEKLYTADFKPSKQYIHIQALGMEQEIPDYDQDSEDETWLHEQNKKMEITPLKFEEMMDRLEKGSGQQVVTLSEAKLLVKEDDDLIIAVYDYWLNKRLRLEMPLISQVKSEKRDGSTTNNPYVAFRRRTEKMQTRKNRKNDEVSYERMLKLKRDMVKASTLTEFLKRREKSKKEILQLSLEILQKRYQMSDFCGAMLADAEAEQAKIPMFLPPYMLAAQPSANGQDDTPPVRKKRQYRRRQKPTQPGVTALSPHNSCTATLMVVSPAFSPDIDVLRHSLDSSEDDFLSPTLSLSEHEDDNDPDGLFAFKRKKLCSYHAPLLGRHGNWPWSDPRDGGKGDKRHRFSLSALHRGRCLGYIRRRVGRGGRVILDRGYSPWDDALEQLNLNSGDSFTGQLGDYLTYVREKQIPYYQAQGLPPEDEEVDDMHYSVTGRQQQFSTRSVSCQQRLAMQQEVPLPHHKQQKLSSLSLTAYSDHVRNHGNCLHRSFSSEPTSRFTLDNASVQFAISALRDSASCVDGQEGVGACVDGVGGPGHVREIVSTAVSDSCSRVVASRTSCSGLVTSSSLLSSVSVSSISTSLSSSLSSQKTAVAVTAKTTANNVGLSSSSLSSSSSSLSVTSLLALSSQSAQRQVQMASGVGCVVRHNGPLTVGSNTGNKALAAASAPTVGATSWIHSKNSASLVHVPVPMAAVLRAVVPHTNPSSTLYPSTCHPSTSTSIPATVVVCGASAVLVSGKTLSAGGNKLVTMPTGVTAGSLGTCNRASSCSSSPSVSSTSSSGAISILKTSHEEGSGSCLSFLSAKDTTPVPMDVS